LENNMLSRSGAKLVAFVLSIPLFLAACTGAQTPRLSTPTASGSTLVKPPTAPAQATTRLPTASSGPAALPAGVLFADNFTDPLSGWDVRHDPDAVTDYQGGAFVIFVGKVNTILWSKPNHYLTDVVVEVDAREAAGPDDNLYGVICRYQDSNNFYRFVIAGNGFAGITKRANGTVTVISAPKLTRSPAVNLGQASNHLKAVCQGNQLSLYVNDQLVAQATDGDFPGGDVGLLASADKHPGVEIHFTNFVVTQP
jgi:hypothetical protein